MIESGPNRNASCPARRLLFAMLLVAPILLAPPSALADGHEFDGYINSTALNVRSGPGVSNDVIGILLKFDPVTVTGAQNVGSTTWYSIKASGGYTNGWVSARFVERGEPPMGTRSGPIDYGAKETPTLMRGPFQYVGAKVCQECHEDAVGDYDDGAYGVWKGHFHSSAYKTLSKSYTREIAQRARGIDDPTTDWRCVKCHVTALGAAASQIGPGYDEAEGVGCEVCHGPGGSYAEEDHGPDVANREAMGFRVLRNLDDRREVCTSCHNTASPTYKPFDLRQFSRKIAHWVDDDDDAYRAEAGRESERRAKALASGAATATKAAAGTAATAVTSSAAAAAEAASRAAQQRAEADAARIASEAAARESAARKAKADAEAAARSKADAAAQAKAEAERQAEAARTAAQAKADQAAAAQRAADEEARAAAAAAKREAEEQKARAAAAAARAQAAAVSIAANPLAHYLDDVDDVIEMNKDGVKYLEVQFPHKKHAGNDYLPDGQCQTCHHTLEDDEQPEGCNECHDIGGDADEEKAKKRYAHAKSKGFPKGPDQEEVSCVGCHKSMNAMLKAGKREGEKAPTKCVLCHEKQ